MKNITTNQRGIAHLGLLFIIALVIIAVSIFAGYRAYESNTLEAGALNTTYPAGFSASLGNPEMLVQQELYEPSYNSRRFSFATNTSSSIDGPLKTNFITSNSNFSTSAQMDYKTGDLYTISSDIGTTFQGIKRYNTSTKAVGWLTTPQQTQQLVAEAGGEYAFQELCAGRDSIVHTYSFYNGSTNKQEDRMYVRTLSTGKSYRVKFDSIGPKVQVNSLNCTANNAYFHLNIPGVSTNIYRVEMNPLAKPTPEKMTFPGIQSDLWQYYPCGGQFMKDNRVVYITNPTTTQQIFVVDFVKKSVKKYSYELVTYQNNVSPYLRVCTVTPDTKSLIYSIKANFSDQSGNFQTKTYNLSTGKKITPSLPDNIDIDGWLGSNIQY